MRTLFKLSLIMLSAGLLSSCSTRPSSKDAQDAFSKLVSEQSKSVAKVKSFEKLNSIDQEVMGQKFHTVEFTAEVEFISGGWKLQNNNGSISTFFLQDKFTSTHVWDKSIYVEGSALAKVVGKIRFEDTEKGWETANIELGEINIVSNPPDQKYYDKFLGTWTDGQLSLRIGKQEDVYTLTFSDNENHTINLAAGNRRLRFYELDRPVAISLNEQNSTIKMGTGVFRKASTENLNSSTNKSKSSNALTASEIVGLWKGKLGEKDLEIVIDRAENNLISGQNTVEGNSRKISGEYGVKSNKTEAVLEEPGDHKWDGVFRLEFSVRDNRLVASGNWKSNNGKLDRTVELVK